MSKEGPQKLVTVTLTLRNYFRVLGIDSTENINKLKQCSDLSMSFFDVESINKEIVNPDDKLCGGPGPTRTYTSLQEPVMIGFADNTRELIDMEAFDHQSDNVYQTLPIDEDVGDSIQPTVLYKNPSDSNPLNMVSLFLDLLDSRRERAKELKNTANETNTRTVV